MPTRPKRPCKACGKPCNGGYCPEHEKARVERGKAEAQRYDKQRGTAAQRGYDSRWAKYSREYRKRNPLCVDCLSRGILTSVEHGGHVDHIKAVTGPDDPGFWDESNHQSLCTSCHSSKTAREDGGLGNSKGQGRVRADCGLNGVPVDARHHWRTE